MSDLSKFSFLITLSSKTISKIMRRGWCGWKTIVWREILVPSPSLRENVLKSRKPNHCYNTAISVDRWELSLPKHYQKQCYISHIFQCVFLQCTDISVIFHSYNITAGKCSDIALILTVIHYFLFSLIITWLYCSAMSLLKMPVVSTLPLLFTGSSIRLEYLNW